MDFFSGLFGPSDGSGPLSPGPSSPGAREKICGDDGTFLLKLISIVEHPDREENTPLELNATALEYVVNFFDRSRDKTQPVRRRP